MGLTSIRLNFQITGDVSSKTFRPWIAAHAAKLGVDLDEIKTTSRLVLVRGRGSPEMLDALMIACSLGPADVLVDEVILTKI